MGDDSTATKTAEDEQGGNKSEQELNKYLAKLGWNKSEQQDAFKEALKILVSISAGEKEKMINQKLAEKVDEMMKEMKAEVKQQAEKIDAMLRTKTEKPEVASTAKAVERDEFARRFFTRISSLPMAKKR